MEKMNCKDQFLSKICLYIEEKKGSHNHNNYDLRKFLLKKLNDTQINKGYFVIDPYEIPLFVNITSKGELDGFLDGDNKGVKDFLASKEALKNFCYSENLEVVKWVLNHKNLTLCMIQKICISNNKMVSDLGKEALKKFINSLDKIKDLKWEKIVKEDYEKTILHLCQIGFAAEFGSQPGNYTKDSKGNYSKRGGDCF